MSDMGVPEPALVTQVKKTMNRSGVHTSFDNYTSQAHV